MTNQEILDAYIKQIEEKMKPLKSEINAYYEENKDVGNLYYLLNEKFSDRITTFTNKYNGSFPDLFTDSEELKALAFVKTVEVCNPLVGYLDFLLENGQ